MQSTEIANFPWSYGQSITTTETTSFKENGEHSTEDLVSLAFAETERKSEENASIIFPAPFQHPLFDDKKEEKDNAYISQFSASQHNLSNYDHVSPNDQSFKPTDIQLELCDRDLWDQFSKVGTEMIVTKTGRRMFPGYRIKITGLDPGAKYCVMMDIVNVDDNRYKFQHGEWTVAGRGEPHLPQRYFLHPDSPATGNKWMKEPISFHKVKLTNSVGQDIDGKVVLNSMHRYQPRVHVVQSDDPYSVHTQPMYTFAFPQTVFITVTAYQNAEVTKLKIDNNPFAKGFRDDGARSKKNRCEGNNFQNDVQFVQQQKVQLLQNEKVSPQPQYTPWKTQPYVYQNSQYNSHFTNNFPQSFCNWTKQRSELEQFMPVYEDQMNFHLQYKQCEQSYYQNNVSPTNITSTPQKRFIPCPPESNPIPMPKPHSQEYPQIEAAQSTDSGIGWSPPTSSDDDTSLISVGGPEQFEGVLNSNNEGANSVQFESNNSFSQDCSSLTSEVSNQDPQDFQNLDCPDEWSY